MQAFDVVGGRSIDEGTGGVVPRLADGVTLLGDYDSAGLRSPRFLARRGDGQVVLLSELLYLVADCADGQHGLAEMAREVSARQEIELGPDDVAYLIDKKLSPLGLVISSETPAMVEAPRAAPILSLAARGILMRPGAVNAVARVFRPMFFPPLVVAVLAGWGTTVGWLLATHRLTPALQTVAAHPDLLLVTFALLMGGSLFHEWGHATACRYGGARPGPIGVGIYLFFPAFFTNVTDSYRLNRQGRLRTDLGGVYFNAAFIVVAGTVYSLTGYAPLVVVIVLTTFEMIEQMLPLVRFDGYFVLSDLIGVPDLFARIGPVLGSLFHPTRTPHPRVAELTRHTRVVVGAWVTIVIPFLLASMVLLIVRLPAFFRQEWAGAHKDWHQVFSAAHSSQWATTVLTAISLIILAVPLVGLVILTVRAIKKALRPLQRGPGTHWKARTTAHRHGQGARMLALATLAPRRSAPGVRFSVGVGAVFLVLTAMSPVHQSHRAINTASVINFRPDQRRAQLSWQEASLVGRNIVANDTAVAYNHCSGCFAESVAIQIVLARPRHPDPATFNLDVGDSALAVNKDCNSCQALALTYQFVIANTTEQVSIRPAGLIMLATLDSALQRMVDQKPPLAVLYAETHTVASEIKSVLLTQLQVTPMAASPSAPAAAKASVMAPLVASPLAPLSASPLAPVTQRPQVQVHFAEQTA
jgi:putative peptide zinc metalloprotease protein